MLFPLSFSATTFPTNDRTFASSLLAHSSPTVVERERRSFLLKTRYSMPFFACTLTNSTLTPPLWHLDSEWPFKWQLLHIALSIPRRTLLLPNGQRRILAMARTSTEFVRFLLNLVAPLLLLLVLLVGGDLVHLTTSNITFQSFM